MSTTAVPIYLDNAATSFPKPEPVYLALDQFARTSLANPGRSGHRMAKEAERLLAGTGWLPEPLRLVEVAPVADGSTGESEVRDPFRIRGEAIRGA